MSASSVLGIGSSEPISGDVYLSGAQVQKIMKSFYGVEVDLDKLASAGTNIMGRSGAEGTGALGTTRMSLVLWQRVSTQ